MEPWRMLTVGVWEEEVDLAMDREKKTSMGEEINQEDMEGKKARRK